MSQLSDIKIEVATKDQSADMLAIYAPFIKDTAVSFETKEPSVDDYWQRIKGIQQEAPWLVCLVEGKVAGFAYAGKHRMRQAYRFTRELSVYIHPDFQRRGIAYALYTSLISILAEQGYATVLAGITLPNSESVLFHEYFGFTKIGEYKDVGFKFQKFHTTGWWELKINDKISGTILPPNEIYETDAWSNAIKKGLKYIR